MMDFEIKRKVIARLSRVKGQVGGIERMVDEGKYCIDILNQISAVQGALGQVSLIIMKNHIETCVSDAIKTGSDLERMKKVEELMEVFSRFGRIRMEIENILEPR